jgi:hypothetical protein
MNELVEQLANSSLYYFRDWKDNNIPSVCAGVYAIYDRHGNFIYIGMAGADLSQERIDFKIANNKKSGLRSRLASHSSGYRSGDQFNIYIGDIYVLNQLAQSDITAISKREMSFDFFIKNYIQKNLSYRYLITKNTEARCLESYIQSFGIYGILPTINSRANKSVASETKAPLIFLIGSTQRQHDKSVQSRSGVLLFRS